MYETNYELHFGEKERMIYYQLALVIFTNGISFGGWENKNLQELTL